MCVKYRSVAKRRNNFGTQLGEYVVRVWFVHSEKGQQEKRERCPLLLQGQSRERDCLSAGSEQEHGGDHTHKRDRECVLNSLC